MMLSSVDLPQPDGPSRATNSSGSTAKSTWLSATTSRPRRSVKVLDTRSATTRILALPQGEPLDLAGRGLGQLGHEVHPARRLVAGQALAHQRLQLGGERVGAALAVAQHAEGMRLGE